jgi:hypothetical protein
MTLQTVTKQTSRAFLIQTPRLTTICHFQLTSMVSPTDTTTQQLAMGDGMSSGSIGQEAMATGRRDVDCSRQANVSTQDSLLFEDSVRSATGSRRDCSQSDADGESADASKAAQDMPSSTVKRNTVDHELTVTLRKLRFLLWAVLLGIMLLSTGGIFFFSVRKEKSSFAAEFQGHAMKLLDSFQHDAQRKLEAMDSLASIIAVHAVEHNEQWPMVTLRHSAVILERYLSIVGAAAIHFFPIVPSHMRKQWEEYAVREQTWM